MEKHTEAVICFGLMLNVMTISSILLGAAAYGV